MTTRFSVALATCAFLLLPLFAPPSSASLVFLPADSSLALRDFAQEFALPMMNYHAELSLHSVALVPLSPAALGVDGLDDLSSRCRVDLQHVVEQGPLVALCDWSPSASSSQFVALQSSEYASFPPPSKAFVVFGGSIRHVREGVTWLMRHLLLHHSLAPSYGWLTQLPAPEPWTAVRSTQLARSMVTMPEQQLHQ
jgi:hypothetical protein